MPLTIRNFQTVNDARLRLLHALTGELNWGPKEWALAVLGELGEFANLLKKCERGDFPLEEKLPELRAECADIITYASLLMSSLGGLLDRELIAKFNLVSQRYAEKAREAGHAELAAELIHRQL